MKIFVYILLVLVSLNCQNVADIATEVKQAHEDVNKAIENYNSEDSQNERSKLASEKQIEQEFVKKLLSRNDDSLTTAMNSVISHSDSTVYQIEKIITNLKSLHTTDSNGRINHRGNKDHVNEIIMTQKRGIDLKARILQTISEFRNVMQSMKIEIHNEEFLLKLNPQTNNQPWEEYMFKDMPVAGAIPILIAYANHTKLTKLYILEKLESTNIK